jgi:hypothetical protein
MKARHWCTTGPAIPFLLVTCALGSACSSSAPRSGGGASPAATSPTPAVPPVGGTVGVDGTPNDAGSAATSADAGDPIAQDGSGTAGNATIVHEWGTYTSVQASDGHSLGGVHHEDEALPAWVHRRNLNDPQNYYFEQLPEEPRQQLETPVLYFYSPTVRDVEVTVSFPQGIVGEWYPDTTT